MTTTPNPDATTGGRKESVMDTTTQPFPFLDAAALRRLWDLLTGPMAATSVALDGAAFGLYVDGQAVTVHVTERDLRFIHALDASRFGAHRHCPVCAADMADDRVD